MEVTKKRSLRYYVYIDNELFVIANKNGELTMLSCLPTELTKTLNDEKKSIITAAFYELENDEEKNPNLMTYVNLICRLDYTATCVSLNWKERFECIEHAIEHFEDIKFVVRKLYPYALEEIEFFKQCTKDLNSLTFDQCLSVA